MKKEQANLFTAISASWQKHKIKYLVLIILATVIGMGSAIKNVENRFDYHLALIQQAHQLEMDKKVADLAQYEMQKNETERVARSQVVSYKIDKFTRISNADEDKMPLEYQNRLAEWAKDSGYDGIVFGRVQPMFDGGVKYATYSGKNEVPIDYVVEKLRKNGCENVISVMSNQSKFWLPYPFTYQVNGNFKVYETGAITAAGFFNIIDSKVKFEGDNFKGTLNDGKMSVKLTDINPWEIAESKEIKKH